MIQLALKDLRLLFKDRRALLLTFAVPIALITLFAFLYGGGGMSNNSNSYQLPVCDLDSSDLSRYAIAQLDSVESLQTIPFTLESAQEAVRSGKEDCVLIFYKGFADSLNSGGSMPVELQYDEAKSVQVGMLQQALMMTLSTLPFTGGNPHAMMSRRFNEMLSESSPESKDRVQLEFDNLFESVQKEITGSANPSSSKGFQMGAELKLTKIVAAKTGGNSLGIIQAVAGTAIMMLLFSVASIGMGLLDEKQEGTLKRLLYSPLNPDKILFGQMISANVIAVFQLLVMFIFASLVFGLVIRPYFFPLLLVIFATAYACSAFGVFLASFAKSRQQVQGLSVLIILVMSAIGGSMMPLFFMPTFMQKMAVVSVNYWGIQSFFDVLWRNLPVSDSSFLVKIGVLILIGTIMNVIALLMFRKNNLKIT